MEIFLIIVLVFFVLVFLYKRKLINLRDNTPFDTYFGREQIKQYNRKLDSINGYLFFNKLKTKKIGIFKRRKNKGNT